MNRLTSNDKDYIFASLNLFYVKDMEVWLRGGGPEPNYDDTTLVELIRRASKTHNLNIEAEDAESLGDEMYDAMFYGVDTVEGIVALLHTAAIQAAVMRNRLAAYEDTGLEPEEIAKIREDVETGYLKSTARRYGIPVDRLRELAKADREGRVVVLPTFCDGCAHHSEHDGKHWCKFWHRYCPDDSDFYCKAAKKLLEGDASDEQA